MPVTLPLSVRILRFLTSPSTNALQEVKKMYQEFFFSFSSQGPEEMCLSLENQNPSKTSEKMGYFDRVTVS